LRTLTRRIKAHQLRIATLHRAVHIGTLHVEFLWIVLGFEQLVVLNISLSVSAAEQIALAHTLRREQSFLYRELVESPVFNWSTSAVPHKLEDERDFFIRVHRTYNFLFRNSRGLTDLNHTST